mmetsp:Transcript_29491/g.74803  ORF Transcript_29491/g.74803 Transcript_29491/m.74803 type:complete len:203 (-) Transcript_29491:925-1533(-)
MSGPSPNEGPCMPASRKASNTLTGAAVTQPLTRNAGALRSPPALPPAPPRQAGVSWRSCFPYLRRRGQRRPSDGPHRRPCRRWPPWRRGHVLPRRPSSAPVAADRCPGGWHTAPTACSPARRSAAAPCPACPAPGNSSRRRAAARWQPSARRQRRATPCLGRSACGRRRARRQRPTPGSGPARTSARPRRRSPTPLNSTDTW